MNKTACLNWFSQLEWKENFREHQKKAENQLLAPQNVHKNHSCVFQTC